MPTFSFSMLRDFAQQATSHPMTTLRHATLMLGIVSLPFGHLLGTIFLFVNALLCLQLARWRFGGTASTLCIPLIIAYCLIVLAEILSPNDWNTTLETAFNYLPLPLTAVIYAGCWRSGINIYHVIQSAIIACILMGCMAIIEVFGFGQTVANGNIVETISIAPREFALVAFLYGMVIASAVFINRVPFVNKTQPTWIVVGLSFCLVCIILSGSRTMLLPTVLVALVALFTLSFNARQSWLAPSFLCVMLFSGVALSGLEYMQNIYGDIFQQIANIFAEPRSGLLAKRLSQWSAGWEMAQAQAIFGHGNIHATSIALADYRPDGWPVFHTGFHFNNAFIDHIILFGALGLSALLISLMAPLVVIGPTWFRLYAALIVLATIIFAVLGRFLNNDITSATMLVVWLSLLLTQSLLKQRTA